MMVSKLDGAGPDLCSGDGWIDVSRPLSPQIPVWPGDRPLDLRQRKINGLLVALPLSLRMTEAAPVRAVLKKMPTPGV